MPEDFIKMGCAAVITAGTLDKLIEEFRLIEKEYNKAEITKETLIVFDFQFNVRAAANEDETKIYQSMYDSMAHHWVEDDDTWNDRTLGMSLSATACEKTTIRFIATRNIKIKYSALPSSDDRQLKRFFAREVPVDGLERNDEDSNLGEIPYSDEMRDLINNVGESLIKLILKLKRVFRDGGIKTLSTNRLLQIMEDKKG